MRKLSIALVLAALVALAAMGAPAAADQSADGRASAWWVEAPPAGVAVNGSYIPIVGDFATTNTRDDIIWYTPGAGVEQVWVSLNNGTFAKQKLNQQVNGTYTPIVGDFGGDALDDIFWYGAGSKPDSLWISVSSHTFQSKPVNVSGTYSPTVLDDKAGKDDIVWWKPGGGAGAIWSFKADSTWTSTPVTSLAGQRLIPGHFDDGTCMDVFVYAPGATADSLKLMNCSGAANSSVAQTVNGTFTPLVQQFTTLEGVGPDSRFYDDILWYRSPGTSVLWESKGDGTWTTSPHSIGAGTPIATAGSEWGIVHLYVPNGPDKVWYDNETVADYYVDSGNTELGTGYTPILGHFVGTGLPVDILWYKAGSAPEALFYS